MSSIAPDLTRVFIVEDSLAIRERLESMLERIKGVSVAGRADSPSGAVEGILHSRPDSVLLDIQLNGGSGIEVLRKIHPQAPEIVFIVMTNYPNPQYRRICMGAGASYFLDKNKDFSRLGEVISSLGEMRH